MNTGYDHIPLGGNFSGLNHLSVKKNLKLVFFFLLIKSTLFTNSKNLANII